MGRGSGEVGGVLPDGLVVVTAGWGIAEREAGGKRFGELEVEYYILVAT